MKNKRLRKNLIDLKKKNVSIFSKIRDTFFRIKKCIKTTKMSSLPKLMKKNFKKGSYNKKKGLLSKLYRKLYFIKRLAFKNLRPRVNKRLFNHKYKFSYVRRKRQFFYKKPQKKRFSRTQLL